MAIEIVATPASASANSYAELAEADAYFAERLGSSVWTSTTDEETRKAALVTAARKIDAWAFRGARATSEQRLQWPRTSTYRAGQLLASDTIPPFLKEAQYEEAIALLTASDANSEDPLAPSGTEQLKSLAAGSVRLEWRDPEAGTRGADDPANALAPAAYRLLKDYLLPAPSTRNDGVRPIRLTR